MKKLFIIVMIVMTVLASTVSFAQNYDTLYIVDHNGETISYCTDSNDGVIVYGRSECPQNEFWVNGEFIYEDLVVIINNGEPQNTTVSLTACASFYICNINYTTSTITNPFAEPFIWKRTGEAIELYAPGNVEWSTGETENGISVIEPGTYSVTITDACGSQTFPIEVYNNVELFRATTELENNRNQATWQTTPEQAEYVQEVNVYRNNQLVATVPYTDGVFTDNIGSADAPWQYHLVAVSNGEECPLRSYWARTISMSDLMGSQGTQTLTWTSYEQENPAKDDEVQAYGIFDVVGGNPRLVREVGSFVNMYNYDPSDFDGYAAVAAIFSRDGKSPLDFEDCAFSNRTEAPLGLGEHETATFSVYPNPSNGVFTVEGAGVMRVMNVLGQIILTKEINGKTTVELPQGLYFVRLGDMVRKIVVE